MNLVYSSRATVDLRALPKADAKRIRDALKQVARDHPQRMAFVTEMVGRPGFWRLRKGDWRAIYQMAPIPLSVTDTTVTLSREEWEAFLDRLEDIADEAVIAASITERERIGDEEYQRLCYTAAEVDRMLGDGISAVTIWRERERLTQRELAAAAGISQSYLAEIEGAKKPGSLAAMAAIAKVLRIPLEHLVQSASRDAAG